MSPSEAQEYAQQAHRVAFNTKNMCCNLLELVDQLGESQALEKVGREMGLSHDLMKRMIIAANGCTVIELFKIAREISDARNSNH